MQISSKLMSDHINEVAQEFQSFKREVEAESGRVSGVVNKNFKVVGRQLKEYARALVWSANARIAGERSTLGRLERKVRRDWKMGRVDLDRAKVVFWKVGEKLQVLHNLRTDSFDPTSRGRRALFGVPGAIQFGVPGTALRGLLGPRDNSIRGPWDLTVVILTDPNILV